MSRLRYLEPLAVKAGAEEMSLVPVTEQLGVCQCCCGGISVLKGGAEWIKSQGAEDEPTLAAVRSCGDMGLWVL